MEKRHLLAGEKKGQNYYLLVFGIVLLIVLLFYFYISFFDVKIGEEKSSEGVLDRASKPLKSLKEIFSGKKEIITSPVGNIRTFDIIESVPLFKFAIIGDYGEATRPNEAAVANLVKSWNVELIITTGDNNYPNGADSTIDNNIGQFYQEFIYPYTGSYGSGSPTLENRFFPSLGNHDWNTAGAVPYLNYFSLHGNERYYDFVKGNVHFYAVDSDSNEPDGTSASSIQASWLQDRLANSPEPLKIVYFHHAPYSSGNVHGSTIYMRWPFEAWGASAVFGGHDHTYERLTVGGIPYFVNGLGGASIYGFGSPLAESQVRYSGNYGAMLVEVYNNKAIFKFININNQVIDSYTILLATTPSVCGNGVLETGEECDDGNNIDGDGCASVCQIEKLFKFEMSVNSKEWIIVKIDDPIVWRQALDDLNGARTLIVSGTVTAGNGGFNNLWSWHLDPLSIVLGNSFIEVCDGMPSWVENNLAQWLGKTYCPWSSRVVSVSLNPPPACTDFDGDGWNLDAVGVCGIVADCDDNNANVNPGASEVCTDGIDNDCNGLIDAQDGICQLPIVTIISPNENEILTSSSVRVEYTKEGNLAGVDHVHLQLDGFNEETDLENDGVHVFSGVNDGRHSVKAYMSDVSDNLIGDIDIVNFDVKLCGNGIPEAGEGCDDGNLIDGDGCSASCTVEIPPCVLTNAYWSKTSAIEKENVNLIVEGTNCDGKVIDFSIFEDDEIIDDNINVNIAGGTFLGGIASGTWAVEWQVDCILEICNPPEYYFNAVLREDNANSISSEGRANGLLTVQELNPTCGNGIPQTGEECDDGNLNNNDACTNVCKNNVCNDGVLYSGVEVCDKDTRDCKDVNNYNGIENCLNDCSGFDGACVITERCGDGFLNGNEVCDKGVLNGQPNQCNLQCTGITASICGNSIPEAGEDCDDGNSIDTDSCTTLCRLTICGDGVVQNPNGQGSNEICDDGLLNGQPNQCNSQCTGITSVLCGNNVVEAGEQCDDGNNIDGDSCTNACLDAVCGDGIKHDGIEECDDGLTGSLSCSAGCKLTKCGDGVVQNPNGLGVSEICELGNEVECSDSFGYKGKALCSGTCEAYADCVAIEKCGDWTVQPLAGEDCDDGNTVDLDGCSATCKNEIIGALPDLQVTSPEAKEYKNTLVPLAFIASNADSCYYVLDGARKDTTCDVNEILNLRPAALNVPENHRIDIFAQNVNGQTTEGVDFSVLYTRSKGIRYDKFRGKGETTNLDDFTDLELGDIDLVLDDGVNGKIKFNEKLDLALEADLNNIIDLDSNVNIDDKKIEIKSDILKGLNKKASLTFRNVGFNDPKTQKDGVDCSAVDCVEASYTNRIYVVDVSGFSVYTVVEGQQPPSDGGSPGDSSGGNNGGSDGGSFITPPKDVKKNESKDNRIVDVIVINGTGEELERVEISREEETQNVNIGEGTRVVLEVEGSGKGEVVDFSVEGDKVIMRVVNDNRKYEILGNDVVKLLLGDKEVYFGVRDIGQGRAIVTLGLEKESVEKEIGIVKPRWISYMLIGIVAMLVLVVAGLIYRYLQFKRN